LMSDSSQHLIPSEPLVFSSPARQFSPFVGAKSDSLGNLLSRYQTDFEEISFLGKGGYGSVSKARNKLGTYTRIINNRLYFLCQKIVDNRFYAIKKIRIDPKKGVGGKLLREVQTLSRREYCQQKFFFNNIIVVHHHNIVRYYQSWYLP
jgi:eukaryotic translation initiation factor 2-alpha kinase 4